MINNFHKIKQMLSFSSEDDFYHLQIIKRKKENPELSSNSMVVKTYYIKSIENLEFHLPEIKLLCEYHNARGYINLNKRSFEKTSFNTLKKITDQIINKDFKSTRNAYNSVCGQLSNAKKDEKRWIIDVDCPVYTNDDYGLFEIDKILSLLPNGVCIAILQTKNGWHLITKPFDLQKYKKHINHDIHKNNPTILISPII